MFLFPPREKTSAKQLKQVVSHLIICNKQRSATDSCIQPVPAVGQEEMICGYRKYIKRLCTETAYTTDTSNGESKH
jgi:hypothetical protein